MAKEKDVAKKGRVAVIGAGISGMSSALLLQMDGWDVTLFESEKVFQPAPALPPVICALLLSPSPQREEEFFIDNLLVRIHLIIEMILVDRPCAMVVRIPFPGQP